MPVADRVAQSQYPRAIATTPALLISSHTARCGCCYAYKVNGKLVYEDEMPHSLIIEKNFLSDLQAILRVYVGSALQLYGDIDEVHEIKIHITSGKVTLLTYSDWGKSDTPSLSERVKINMLNQSIRNYKHSSDSI